MAWVYLAIAGVMETAWAIGLKYSQGFTRLGPSLATIVAMAVSLLFLAKAVRSIPIGTGYAAWTGIGAVGTALLGMVLFDESRDPVRFGCIVLVVLGIAGLNLTASA